MHLTVLIKLYVLTYMATAINAVASDQELNELKAMVEAAQQKITSLESSVADAASSADLQKLKQMLEVAEGKIQTLEQQGQSKETRIKALEDANTGAMETIANLQNSVDSFSTSLDYAIVADTGDGSHRLDTSAPSQGVPYNLLNRWIERKFDTTMQSSSVLEDPNNLNGLRLNPGKYMVMGYSTIRNARGCQVRFRIEATGTTEQQIIMGATHASPDKDDSALLNVYGVVEIKDSPSRFYLETIATEVSDPGAAGGLDLVKVSTLGQRTDFSSTPEFSKILILKIA